MDEWKRVACSDESRFLIHHVDGRVRVRHLPGEQLLHSWSYTGWWWRCYALGDVLMGGSGTLSCGRTGNESRELSEHHCGSVAPLHGVCLPNWKWNLPAGQCPMSQGSDCVGVVRGAYDELHLISRPPNSPDLNPMERIWVDMERQLRAQTPPCPNISTLR
ncbi:hypothetical protein AVEN_85449-1 [Araneus ventricosus]|uniref:Tc1-like transposase DDE domain-containing protein n=1 Tax=Araneus ventricosus TaxID=182803 RepID=A0A4Y2GVM9_ARAVE|nr:hypothetical protein AVEN_85449-1 [Araneus ventricosus]